MLLYSDVNINETYRPTEEDLTGDLWINRGLSRRTKVVADLFDFRGTRVAEAMEAFCSLGKKSYDLSPVTGLVYVQLFAGVLTGI